MIDFKDFNHRHELGLYLPPGVAAGDEPPQLRHTGTYLTLAELSAALGARQSITEQAIVDRLQQMAAADCMAHLSLIATKMHAAEGPYFRREVQQELIAIVAGEDSPVGRVLLEALDRGEPTTIFCEQQVVHLARLVALHADSREHDDFRDGDLYDEWVTCLFGTTDLLDSDLRIEDRDDRLSWELRQCGINHHDDLLPSIGLHHEIYRVLIPERFGEASTRIETAFEEHTGLSLADFFIIGAAVHARFLNHPGSFLEPATYFDQTALGPEDWEPFFDLIARNLTDLKAALKTEEERYGPTTYGSLAIERFPLFEAEAGRFLAISPGALVRRITEGVFHLLAEAAEDAGENRTTHTRGFGIPFQESVEQTLRRGNEATGKPVAVVADVLYGRSRSSRRRSSDVILAYERQPVFVEVVSGPMRVGTMTRGDLDDFEADVNRLVIGKAEQLDTSIESFFEGHLEIEGLDPTATPKAWPVIVTSHAFPLRDSITEAINERLIGGGHLQGERFAPLAVISAEELFFCEGFMEQGKTFLSLISGWKSDPASASHSFKNYLIELGGGNAPGSSHFEHRFAEASVEQAKRLFDREHTPSEILAHARGEVNGEG